MSNGSTPDPRGGPYHLATYMETQNQGETEAVPEHGIRAPIWSCRWRGRQRLIDFGS
jgi:hypothetical protein